MPVAPLNLVPPMFVIPLDMPRVSAGDLGLARNSPPQNATPQYPPPLGTQSEPAACSARLSMAQPRLIVRGLADPSGKSDSWCVTPCAH